MTDRKKMAGLPFLQWIFFMSLISACKSAGEPTEFLPTISTVTAFTLPAAPPAPPVPTKGGMTARSMVTREKDGMRMVQIDTGGFSMGSESGEPDERPVHQVFLDTFWIDETEVTNAMYSACVSVGACSPPLELGSYTRDQYYDDQRFAKYPVIHVDWSMAAAYCKWVEARLPSEAEWEMAAGGSQGSIYPWGENWDVKVVKRLNFADRNNPEAAVDLSVDDGFADTSPVGSFPAGRSEFGLYDLAGNVWEWIADWYDPAYYAVSPAKNPTGPDVLPLFMTEKRVLRGGSWVASQDVFRVTNRNGLEPTKSSSSIGFRCAR